jgi:hypothetical protein
MIMTTTNTYPSDMTDVAAWNTAYADADKINKAAMRSHVKSIMMAAIDALDMDAAHAAKSILDGFTSVRPKSIFDATAAHADKINSLRAAVHRAIADAHNASDVDRDRLADMIVGDYTDDHAARGTKIANGVSVRSGDRAPGRDLSAVFADIVATVEPGTFMTVAEITKWGELPSSGAVAARLFPASGVCTVPNVTPCPATATAPRGAVFGA